ncbi:ubiquitin-like superfamily protein [Artemisia annua]|uniref:Ubiquitin-like superfamily protein n=1 Tax=Artemisia annua TaxID=35608 RepID=A0A2U1KWA9_ARTAN|nr:ubiquitin-like superfamily protein [Artemisia annua]
MSKVHDKTIVLEKLQNSRFYEHGYGKCQAIRIEAMYIRVKRNKTTYFLQCDATEKILDIKQKLHDLIDQPVFDQRLILVATGEVLDDSKTLADQKVENDAVVALVLRKDDNEFEDVNIVKPDDFYPSRDADPSGNW